MFLGFAFGAVMYVTPSPDDVLMIHQYTPTHIEYDLGEIFVM